MIFCIASSLDNLFVGVAYGIVGARIPLGPNMVIALVSAMAGGLSLGLGRLAASAVNQKLATAVGALILGGMGLWIILKACLEGCAPPADGSPRSILRLRLPSLGLVFQILKEPLKADRDKSGTIDTKEALSLGLALALNNVANGVPAGFMGFPLLATSLCMGLFSLVCLEAGCFLGRMAGSKVAKRAAGILSGAVLLLVSFLSFFMGQK